MGSLRWWYFRLKYWLFQMQAKRVIIYKQMGQSSTQAMPSAFANERRPFAYVIMFTLIEFKPITCVRHNSDLAK